MVTTEKKRRARTLVKKATLVASTKLNKLSNRVVNIVREHNGDRSITRENTKFIRSLTNTHGWDSFVSIGVE